MSMAIQGDCLDVLPSLEPGSVDFVFADLPYGTTRNRWDTPIDLPTMWSELRRVVKPSGAMVFTAQVPFDKVLGASNLSELRYEWVWEKTLATGFLNARRMPLKAHENVLVFYRSMPEYHPQKTSGHTRKTSTVAHKRNSRLSTNYGAYAPTTYDSTERYPRSVLTIPTDKQRSSVHPTQKPVALVEYMINTYTSPGAVVLDPTAGSMTTGVAAYQTGRQYVLIEKDPDIYSSGVARLQEEGIEL